MTIAVVIPVLNERPNLPLCIASISRGLPGAQIVVSDGGSTDGSLEWLATQSNVAVVTGTRGKGPQLNAGVAAAADAEVLLFLHADCELPAGTQAAVAAALDDPKVIGGAFFVLFEESNPRSLHLLAWGMNMRLRMLRRSFGDQALFVRREVFERVQGFPDWTLFEDYEFVRRIKARGRFAVVRTPITLGARRFIQHGVWRTVFKVLALQLAFYIGVHPRRLKHWFADIRPHLDGTS